MSAVQINRLGVILDGPRAGLYVRVQPSGGGFSIIWSDYADMWGGEHGSDDWVEPGGLDRYFEDLQVDWTIPETEYEPPG